MTMDKEKTLGLSCGIMPALEGEDEGGRQVFDIASKGKAGISALKVAQLPYAPSHAITRRYLTDHVVLVLSFNNGFNLWLLSNTISVTVAGFRSIINGSK